MNERKNCWEYSKCGYGPDEINSLKKGMCCPAASSTICNGINKGKDAGRFCWSISGTFCNEVKGKVSCFKLCDCIRCPFLSLVIEEEGRNFLLTPQQVEKHYEETKDFIL